MRGGSKGVPRKNIRPLKGKPLMQYTVEAARQSKLLDDFVISTDDDEIAAMGRSLGVNIPAMRPAKLAQDTTNKWDVFRHVIEVYEQQTGKYVDYIVDMDVTVPLKLGEDIDNTIAMALADTDTDVVITGYEPERNPYFNMMEVNKSGFAEIVKKPVIPIVRRQDAPLVYSLTPAAFVIKRSAIFDFPHWSLAKCKVCPMPRNRAVDIDTEFDFKLVEFIISQNNAK